MSTTTKTRTQSRQQSRQQPLGTEERIRRRTEASLEYHLQHPDEIPRRLEELDAEWSLERALATSSSGLTLLGLVFSVFRGSKWLLMSLGVQGYCLRNALQSSKPAPALRCLGLRTAQEIEEERAFLRSIRGDQGGRGGAAERESVGELGADNAGSSGNERGAGKSGSDDTRATKGGDMAERGGDNRAGGNRANERGA